MSHEGNYRLDSSVLVSQTLKNENLPRANKSKNIWLKIHEALVTAFLLALDTKFIDQALTKAHVCQFECKLFSCTQQTAFHGKKVYGHGGPALLCAGAGALAWELRRTRSVWIKVLSVSCRLFLCTLFSYIVRQRSVLVWSVWVINFICVAPVFLFLCRPWDVIDATHCLNRWYLFSIPCSRSFSSASKWTTSDVWDLLKKSWTFITHTRKHTS